MVGYMILLNSSWTNVVSALDEHEPNPNVKHRTACVGSTVFSGTGRDTTGNEKARWNACPQGQFTIPRTISRGGINNHSELMFRIYWIIGSQSSTGNTRCLSMRLCSEVDTAGQPSQLRRGSIMNSMHIKRQASGTQGWEQFVVLNSQPKSSHEDWGSGPQCTCEARRLRCNASERSQWNARGQACKPCQGNGQRL